MLNKKQKNIISVIILLIGDLGVFYLSLIMSYYTRIYALHFIESYLREFYPRFPLVFPLSHFFSFWWMPLLFLGSFAYEKLYSERFPFWEEAKLLIKATLIATLSISAILFIGHLTTRTSAVAIAFLFMYGSVFFPLERYFIKKLLFKFHLWQQKAIILGGGKAGIITAKGLLDESHMGYKILGFLDDDENKIGHTIEINKIKFPIIDTINNVIKVVRQYDIDIVIVAIPSLEKNKYVKLAQKIQKEIGKLLVVPDIQGLALLNTRLSYLFMEQIIFLSINNNLYSVLNKTIKRIFDISLTLISIPILLPVFFLIGILIKLESKGPVFFKHTRVGEGGKLFKVYKFRTMYTNAEEMLNKLLNENPELRKEWEQYYKLKNDPRVTKIGKFLRRTSLDELPQIFNVLLGQMSLVGPRPVIKDELNKYYKQYKEYYYLTKPGISGLWQISGRNMLSYDDRVKLDVWYVLNWSLWLDIIILFKTIGSVLKREGAY